MLNIEMKYPKQAKVNTDPLSRPIVISIVGSRGSGKSTLMVNLLDAIDDKRNIETEDCMIFSGNAKDPLLEHMNCLVSDKRSDYDDFTMKIDANKDPNRHFLLVLDDMQSSTKLNVMNARNSDFTNLVLGGRHQQATIIVTAQTIRSSFSNVFKNNVDLWFIFEARNPSETKALTEYFDNPDFDKAYRTLRMRNIESEKEGTPRNFLYINFQSGKPRFFINFKEELQF